MTALNICMIINNQLVMVQLQSYVYYSVVKPWQTMVSTGLALGIDVSSG